jgi:beta-lactamase regulating signal transducer with metallopeptidase domain
LKRGDLIWDWFPAIARMLFFFHPVAHWAAGRTLLERELACDQAALRLSNRDEAGYARMLVRVASLASFPLRAGTAGDGKD